MAEAPTTAQTSTPLVVQPVPEKKIIVRMREQHAVVHDLVGQGMSKAAIGRQLGLHPATVRKLAQAATVEELTTKTEQRTHLVDDYVEYLHRRWNEGERNATGLFREIAKLGYPGGELAVQRYLRRFRDGRGHAALPGPKPPTVREVTSWVMTHPDRLGTDEACRLRQIRNADAELDRLTTHVRGWATMMTELRGHDLEQWIVAVEQDTLAPLASFARNLRRDQDAVHAGLTLQHSSGRVEGTVNKIKMLKRQMFGRANFDLLRTRVLHSPDTAGRNPDHAECARTKIRDGKVANRPIYVALAVTVDGHRDILGLWAGDSDAGGEGAKYWLHVLTEIKNRGVNDVLMVVCDGLKGLPDAIEQTWPQAVTQTCVVHLLRNSFRYAGRQHRDAIAKALQPIYTAPTEAAAMERFLEFCEAWGERYPAIVRLWENAWAEFVPFLSFDAEIRKIVCTTNAIESVNARIRRAVKARGHFPNEAAALKCVYMAIMSLDPTGTDRRRWSMRWKPALNAFDIAFDGRLSAGRN